MSSLRTRSKKTLNSSETIELSHDYGEPIGDLQLGIRPEFMSLTKSGGLPVQIKRVQNVGRHKFINASLFGVDINIVADEGFEIESNMTNIQFNSDKINIFCNDWRIDPTQPNVIRKAAV